MRHFASSKFWSCYQALGPEIQRLADGKYQLLKTDPHHPSLHLKRVGAFWSCRVGLFHRALGVGVDGGILWFWIGDHAGYDRLIG